MVLSVSLDIDANLANVTAGGHIFQCLDDAFLAEVESLLHRNSQIVISDEPDHLFEQLLRSNDDTTYYTRLRQRETSHIRHLILRSLREKANDRDDAAELDGINRLLDCARSAVFEDVIHTSTACDPFRFGGPVRCFLVVDRVVHTELLLYVLQLLVARGRDDRLGSGSSGEDQTSDRDSSSACTVLADANQSSPGEILALKQNHLARAKWNVAEQGVPRSHTGTHQSSPLLVLEGGFRG